MSGSGVTPAGRIGAAALAAAAGLVVGATGAAALGTVQALLSPGLEIASTPRALIVGPLMMMAEGLLWSLLGGSIFVFPPVVVAFAVFRPRNTRTAALAIFALIFVPIVFIGFPGRLIDALVLSLPIWFGVRVSLRLFSRMVSDDLPLVS